MKKSLLRSSIYLIVVAALLMVFQRAEARTPASYTPPSRDQCLDVSAERGWRYPAATYTLLLW